MPRRNKKSHNTSRLQMLHDETEENIQANKEARNVANCVVRRQKGLAEKKAIEDIENYKMNLTLFFKQCKLIKKEYKLQNSTMSDNDEYLISRTQAIDLFKKHFGKLLDNNETK